MFWPPRPCRRLPPTKATSANPQTAASSPIVSIKMIGTRTAGVPRNRRRHPAAAHDRLALLFQPVRHAVESFGVARHQDQPQARVLPPRGLVRRQDRGFLSFHRAPGHEDQVGRGQAEQLPQLARLAVVPVALQPVVLDRTGNADPMARNSQLDKSPGIFPILGGHDVDAAERRLQRCLADCGIHGNCVN